MMDAVEYFAAVDDAREARKPLCEADEIFLEEAEEKMQQADVELRGYCRSCGDPIPHLAGFCDPCKHIERVSNIRKSRELGHVCIDCGADISHKGKGAFFCDLCKDKRHKMQQAESNFARWCLKRVKV